MTDEAAQAQDQAQPESAGGEASEFQLLMEKKLQVFFS